MAPPRPKKAAQSGRMPTVRLDTVWLDGWKSARTGKAPAAKASKPKAAPAKKASKPTSGYGKYVKHKESSGNYTTHVASYWRRR